MTRAWLIRDHSHLYLDGPRVFAAWHVQRRRLMTKLTLLSTALVAVALLATPAMAREHHARRAAAAADAYAAMPYPDYQGYYGYYGRACTPAPRVGAFATAPWTGDNVPCEPGPYGYYNYY
jgi:hypothetical protein